MIPLLNTANPDDERMDTDPVYREVQRFRQRWLWGLFGGLALLMGLFGPVAALGLAILGAVGVFIYSIRLRTEVRADGIYVQLWPLHQSYRQISWDEIEHYEARRYEPLREFGGWGIRWAPGKLAYSAGGNHGAWIQRTDERSILIGSQRAEEFVSAIDELNEN